MLSVIRTARAEDDLIAIWLRVARDNQVAADRLLDRIEARWRQLAAQPFSGAARDDILTGIRQLTTGNYLIFYRVSRDTVEIVRVLDGRRDIGANHF